MYASLIPLPTAKRKIYQLFFFITAIEGVFAFIFLFRIPSEDDAAFLFGYSAIRIALGGLVLAVLGLLAWAALYSTLAGERFDRLAAHFECLFTQNDDRLLALVTALAFFLLSGFGFLFLFSSPLAENLNTLRAVFERSFSLWLWAMLGILQVLAALGWIFGARYRQLDFFKPIIVVRIVLVLAVLTATAFHWLILLTQDALFTAIDGWFWQFDPQPFAPRDVIFAGPAILALLVASAILHSPQKTLRNLGLLVVLSYVLQHGFGFMKGDGLESLRLKFIESGHSQLARRAADRPDFFDALINYEVYYSQDIILGTKPPGAFGVYLLSHKIADFFDPQSAFEERLFQLTHLGAVVFPILASLSVLLVYSLARPYLGQGAVIATLFYLLCPNYLLMVLHLDQFFFPALFAGGLIFLRRAIGARSAWLAFFSGAYAYLALYFSFSLLPLLALTFLWPLVDYWSRRSQLRLADAVKFLAFQAAGLAAAVMAFRLLLNYDILLRYQNAFAIHRSLKLYQPGLAQIFEALLVNNCEFAFWSGIVIFAFALSWSLRSISRFLQDRAGRLEGLMVAFAVVYAVLNIFGQTRGEVGRLWLFMLPLASLAAAAESGVLFKRRSAAVYGVICLQLVTTLLTFKFQDFY